MRRGRDQPGDADDQQNEGGANRRPQRPRGAGAEGELPPELVRIRHVLVCEQCQPDRCAQRGDGCRDSAGRRARIEERGAPIERRSGAPENEEHADEQQGFLEVESLQDRCDGSRDNRHDGEVVGPVEAPRQALGNHQQYGASHAPEKMRALDDGEREHALDHAQSAGRRGDRARQQEDDAKEERERGQYPRRQLFGQRPEHATDLRDSRSRLAELVHEEHDQSDCEGNQIVDRAKYDESRQKLFGRQERMEEHHHQAFEDTDTARDVTRQAEECRRQECAEKSQERQLARRQQHIEHGGEEGPLERRERKLCGAQAKRRQRHIETPQAKRPLPDLRGDEERHWQDDKQPSDKSDHPERWQPWGR